MDIQCTLYMYTPVHASLWDPPPPPPPLSYSGKAAEQFIAEKIEQAPKQATRENTLKLPRIPKKGDKGSILIQRLNQTTSSGHNDHSSDRTPPPPGRDHLPSQALTVSNHIPFSPQIVEVNVPLSESEETGSIHGNSAHLMEGGIGSEPSSPGSDSGLRIDLGGTDLDLGKKDRSRVRMAPSATKSMLKGGTRKPNLVPHPGEPYYDSSYSLIGGTEAASLTPTAFRPLRGRPGETLSALATTLAERRAAELREQAPGYDLGLGLEEERTGFSTMYPPEKRAIAVVDPDEKRTPRRKQRRGMDTSPSKKSRRLQEASRNNNDVAAAELNVAPSYMDTSPSANGLISSLPSGSTSLTGSSGDPSYLVGMQEMDDQPLEVGEGLLADTIRCVDRTFQTRLDTLAGSRDDLGYQYFSEKVRMYVHVCMGCSDCTCILYVYLCMQSCALSHVPVS